ncbi:hypothetical protein SAMN03159341_102706 [Paenibacillus sp. 1_12]|uniref:hypothetical protein n=1 Tax=Paenibacillus sp. 1_12 TaxID=1566278 RepID=UPI0008F3BBFF|nr:hypothetical protein [Paenibacillus sp. 1_12]SFL01038.1 hypothetical protein SAMN03159341_102706 [Paenibacillus sp. 1_12]
MKEDIHLYMKIGIVHHTAFPLAGSKSGGTLESITDIVSDHFFDAIEITSIHDSNERTEVKQTLLSGGMMVCFNAIPQRLTKPLNLGSVIEHERHSAIQMIKEAVDEAYEMNAEIFTISDDFISEAFFHEHAVRALNESFKEIYRHAALKGTMKVAYRPPFSTVSHSVTGKFPRIEQDQFGFLIDLDHLPVNYEMNDKNMKYIKKHLLYSRMGNCCKIGRYNQLMGKTPHQRNQFTAVHADQLLHFLRNLYKFDYIGEGNQGVLSLNVKTMDYESPHSVIANGKRTLLEAWRILQLNQTIWPNC